ncbi:hypothetical protein STVA_24210 [Allostella vacuolata]|nr:hypothetical protein STVA_24210 [Stella vacuolata]
MLASACTLLTGLPDIGTTLWLANAAAIAFLLDRPGQRLLPGLAAVAAASTTADLLTGSGPAPALALAATRAAEVGLAMAMARRLTAGDRPDGHRIIGTMLGAGILAPAVMAPVAGAVLAWAHGTSYLTACGLWWIASATGAALILPCALTLNRRAIARFRRLSYALEFAGLVGLTLAVTLLALMHLRYPYVVMAFPLILAVLRLDGPRTALLTSATVAWILLAIEIGALRTGRSELWLHQHFAVALITLPPFVIAVLKDGLMASEARFRRAIDESAVGMALLGLDGRWIRVNAAAARMLGYTPAEMMRRSLDDIVHAEDRHRDLDALAGILDGSRPNHRAERRYVRKDGRIVWALVAISAIHDEATGEPRCFIVQIEDIDQRKRAEARLKESETRWQFALETAGQGVWDRDVMARRTYYSRTWKAMLGYEANEIGHDSRTWEAFLHPRDRARILALDRQCVEGEADMFEAEFRMRHREGHWIWVHNRARIAHHDEAGRALRIIGTHTDITQRKQAEEAFQVLAERTQLAVQASGVGIWEMDLSTERLSWDLRMHELYGVTPESFGHTRADWEHCVHPDDRVRVRRELDQALAVDAPYDTEFRIVRRDSTVRHMRTLGRVVRELGQSARIIGTHWDVTEQRRLTDALYEEKERLRITLYSIGDAVISTDARMRVTFMNPIAEQLTGWPMSEAEHRPLTEVFHIVDEHTGEPITSPVEECLLHMRPFYLQDGAVLVSRGGDRLNVQDSAAPVRTASGEIIGAVLVFQDITRAHELQKQLTHSALHDALTDLPNRPAFEHALQELRQVIAGSQSQATLCFLDLDRFKIVNDSAGHAAGDALLRLIGRTIRASVRPEDLVARLGGDEFGILLRDCPVEEGTTIAQRVIEAIKSVRFPWEGRVYDIGASIGLTGISDWSPSYEELLKEADVACYAAKAGGRNRLSVYSAHDGDADRYHREIQVASGIRAAIEANRFRLYAQQIHDLRRPSDGRRHFEILLRLVDERGELTSPSGFIPAAERYDLMGSIDRWVIGAVLRTHRAALQAAPDIALAINLSANSLSDPLLWPFVLEELREAGIAPDRLHFEITETAIINNFAIAVQFVTAVRAAGVRIVLDDFGSGLSSFSYLKQFEIDYLKIDGSFVRNLQHSAVDRRIVESINDVGHALGVTTVAECVEDAATLQAVREMGIDMAQGYHLDEPQPIETLFERSPGEAHGRPAGAPPPREDGQAIQSAPQAR